MHFTKRLSINEEGSVPGIYYSVGCRKKGNLCDLLIAVMKRCFPDIFTKCQEISIPSLAKQNRLPYFRLIGGADSPSPAKIGRSSICCVMLAIPIILAIWLHVLFTLSISRCLDM